MIDAIEKLSDIRNHVHLEKIANSKVEEEFYYDILKQEENFLKDALKIMRYLQSLKTE